MIIEMTKRIIIKIDSKAPAHNYYKTYLRAEELTEKEYSFKDFIEDNFNEVGVDDDEWSGWGDIMKANQIIKIFE